jgi:hypothetical protein
MATIEGVVSVVLYRTTQLSLASKSLLGIVIPFRARSDNGLNPIAVTFRRDIHESELGLRPRGAALRLPVEPVTASMKAWTTRSVLPSRCGCIRPTPGSRISRPSTPKR